jgi:hypothetical protein
MELVIRLSFVNTSEFQGGLKPFLSVYRCLYTTQCDSQNDKSHINTSAFVKPPLNFQPSASHYMPVIVVPKC